MLRQRKEGVCLREYIRDIPLYTRTREAGGSLTITKTKRKQGHMTYQEFHYTFISDLYKYPKYFQTLSGLLLSHA